MAGLLTRMENELKRTLKKESGTISMPEAGGAAAAGRPHHVVRRVDARGHFDLLGALVRSRADCRAAGAGDARVADPAPPPGGCGLRRVRPGGGDVC